MVEPAHVAVGEGVGVAEAGPAVGPVHELVREPEGEVRVVGEVGERRDAEPLGLRLAHPDGVRVVEPERPAHLDAEATQPLAHRVHAAGLAAQDFQRDRAGVFGVRVDVAAPERLPQHPRPADLRPVLGRDALRPPRLRDDSRRGSPTR